MFTRHDKRTVLLHWFIDWLPCYQYKFSILSFESLKRYPVRKSCTMVFLNSVYIRLVTVQQLSLIYKYDWIPYLRYLEIKLGFLIKVHIKIIGWSLNLNWPFYSFPLSSYNFYSFVFLFNHGNLRCLQLLIPWLYHFIVSFEIKPQLKSNRCYIIGSWHLWVHNTLSSRHPLYITRTNYSFMTFEILVNKFSIYHVCDCFESSMRMVRKTCR